MKPLGCIHKETIGATIFYKDHQWKKHTLEMKSKEVHCVCPFLKEKTISRAEFLLFSNSGYIEERGVNFEGISNYKLVDFLAHTCKNRLYKVDEFPIEGGRIIYLAGDALGEKSYYLLTAIIKEFEGLTQVLLRASSDKSYGLNGFLNEILDNLHHLVQSTTAREIGIIRREQVINIIDSVVQNTTFAGGKGANSIKISDSIVQRTEFNAVDEEKKREEAERLQRKEEEEKPGQIQQEQVLIKREEVPESGKGSSNKFFAVVVILAVLGLGYWALATGGSDAPESKITPSPTSALSSTNQKSITNSIGMEFVIIPAGEFDMGSPSDEKDRSSDEGPVHRVKIAKAFYIGKYEVTQKEWQAVMGNNPSGFKGDDLPVEQVSWNDIQEFVKRLNQKEGTNKYRLPSEAEWEYAARARTTTHYSFGDSESLLKEYAWFDDNSGSKTHPVGQNKPNPWGLYDMHGNVWEWVQDSWHSNYDSAPVDGSAWESGSGSDRVIRSGSWDSYARNCRSAVRSVSDPDFRFYYLGFRLVQEI